MRKSKEIMKQLKILAEATIIMLVWWPIYAFWMIVIAIAAGPFIFMTVIENNKQHNRSNWLNF